MNVYKAQIAPCAPTDILRKTHAWKALTQFFQSEMRPFTDEIRARGEDVKEEFGFAKAQSDSTEQSLQAAEREEAVNGRKQISSWFSESKQNLQTLGYEGRNQAAGRSPTMSSPRVAGSDLKFRSKAT
ncbi:hypothetical protein EDB80DRAFT_727985 [Ilyonectria destructans]|nr:hypothetical protein EDB80DRAFT_727985 [Ilyonectria destructans]